MCACVVLCGMSLSLGHIVWLDPSALVSSRRYCVCMCDVVLQGEAEVLRQVMRMADGELQAASNSQSSLRLLLNMM